MIEPKIFLSKATRNIDGSFKFGEPIDILAVFKGATYKSANGYESIGKPKIYSESYPESPSVNVFYPSEKRYEPTDFQLDLCFFDSDKHEDEADAIKAIDDVYYSFINTITDGYIKLWDNVRQRKVVLSYQDATTPITDSLYGVVYKEVVFKFTNVYGISFPISEDEKIWNNH